ncbi:hypothetical protein JMJ56_02540 [Belnapia sp. T18]|uniref:Uncharacterized protein n=1 Tax=Belnapia arida TaxID=2804533 RepID=A0ABS1TZI1_9PROT|nr:hypothetical protein [Belnapia arida]MBL6076867.1 hypothetical protein [Belnapia arida]
MDDIARPVTVRTPLIRMAPRLRASHCALAALCLGLLPAPSAAQPYYPCIIGSNEDRAIDYGPGPHGNIIGGGHVIISGGGENTTFTRLDPQPGQPPRAGMMPVTLGNSESATVWVPADTDRLWQALIGGDGSVPEAGPSDASVRKASRQAGPHG